MGNESDPSALVCVLRRGSDKGSLLIGINAHIVSGRQGDTGEPSENFYSTVPRLFEQHEFVHLFDTPALRALARTLD